MIAYEYGWTPDYILDQSYSAIQSLADAIRVRKYLQLIQTYNLQALANGGTADAIERFFEAHKPVRESSEEYDKSPHTEVVLPRGMKLEEA